MCRLQQRDYITIRILMMAEVEESSLDQTVRHSFRGKTELRYTRSIRAFHSRRAAWITDLSTRSGGGGGGGGRHRSEKEGKVVL